MSRSSRRARAAASARAVLAGAAAALALGAGPAGADWLYPDPGYRDAQYQLRAAIRDTFGHGDDPVRLDTLGVALMQLGRLKEAGGVFRRVLALKPGDVAATGALGKLALFDDRLAEADSLLVRASEQDPAALADLFAARYRAGHWEQAADLAAEIPGLQGREAKLRALAEEGAYRIAWQGEQAELRFRRLYPVPLVQARINGKLALLAIDTGIGEMLLDPSARRRLEVRELPGKSPAWWDGVRIPVGHGIAARLELGEATVEQVPVQIYGLRDYSLTVNPQGERVDGIIGLELLRRFTPTLDYPRARLVLRRAPPTPGDEAQRVPFQIWGEHELTVQGSLNGGRSMFMVVTSGLPECGVASATSVFDEVGVKSTALSRVFKGAGKWLGGQGWSQVVVPTMSVGKATATRVEGWSGVLDQPELWWHGVRRDGLVSHNFLRRFRVTIDWSHRVLVLDKPS